MCEIKFLLFAVFMQTLLWQKMLSDMHMTLAIISCAVFITNLFTPGLKVGGL